MRNFRSIIVCLAATASLQAMAQHNMYVWNSNGNLQVLNTSEIGSITFDAQNLFGLSASEATETTDYTFTTTVNVTRNNASAISVPPEVGICVSKNGDPTVDDMTFKGNGSQEDVAVTATGLEPGTTYRYRAYVRLLNDVFYGEDILTATTTDNQMFAGGDGTAESPYLIAKGSQMKNIASVMTESNVPVYFKLTKDIDMTDVAWTPFNAADPYKNAINFDGDGHTISNFSHTGGNYPSFAGVLNGVVKNVKFVNANVTATGQHAGIIAGYLGTNGIWGQIENVSVQGTVKQEDENSFCGGLAGNQRYGIIKNCWVMVDVDAATNNDRGTGGIVGYQYDGKNLKDKVDDVNCAIINCYYEGEVTGKDITGGILGKSENRWGNYVYGNISNATSIHGGNETGTVIGRCYPDCIKNGRTHDNYGSRDCKLFKNGKEYTPDINDIYNDGNTHFGAPMGMSATETARTIGWDETVWDFSDEKPMLKIFK